MLRYFKGGEMALTFGSEPTKLFFCKQIAVSDELLKRASGSSPVSILLMSLSTWREPFTKDSGIAPERLLLPRSTCVRDELLQNSGLVGSHLGGSCSIVQVLQVGCMMTAQKGFHHRESSC